MKIAAMVMAAGRGERMRPLSDLQPKPLLRVHGRPLIESVLQSLAQGACSRAVINTAWLGEQISEQLGAVFEPQAAAGRSGARLPLAYSKEGQDFGRALETAGGIARALPLLCPDKAAQVFWLAAADVYAPDFEFAAADVERFLASDHLAQLWLVPNPAHHLQGDFGISASGLAQNLGPDDAGQRWTYSTIGLFRAALFQKPWCTLAWGNPQGESAALAPLLRAAMDQGRIAARLYRGHWVDVGTPERLALLNQATIH